MFINPLLVIALVLLNLRTVLLSLSFMYPHCCVFVASQNQPLGAEAKPLSGGRFKARRIDYTKLAGYFQASFERMGKLLRLAFQYCRGSIFKLFLCGALCMLRIVLKLHHKAELLTHLRRSHHQSRLTYN